jgi:hypothetical protein
LRHGRDGAVASRFSFTHDGAAIGAMAGRLRAARVAGVAIERGDGPVVEELLGAGLAVFVVPSRQIKGLRSRYGSAGYKDDRFDAYVLADTLRTDGHRWKPLRPTPGRPGRCGPRAGPARTWPGPRVQVLGQLRANLELAFPGAIGLFTKPYSAISLAFLQRFPTAAKAAWLSPRRLASWLRSVGYTGGVSAGTLHDRLAAAAPGLAGAEGEARGQITLALGGSRSTGCARSRSAPHHGVAVAGRRCGPEAGAAGAGASHRRDDDGPVWAPGGCQLVAGRPADRGHHGASEPPQGRIRTESEPGPDAKNP